MGRKRQRRSVRGERRAERPPRPAEAPGRERGYPFTLKLLVAGSILLLAFLLRFSSAHAINNRLLMDYDEYWHLHILNQMAELGYRPAVDWQAWAPTGRPMVHPPGYHYFLYLVWRILPNVSTFDVVFWCGPFLGVLGALGWLLLCRELYGGLHAGLIGASIYAVLLLTISPTLVGAARPQALAEVLLPHILWLYLRIPRAMRGWLQPLPGLLLGLLGLIWESSLYLYLPLIIVYWGGLSASGRATGSLHLYTLITILAALAVALPYWIPIYTAYGIWGNTPPWMLEYTNLFKGPDLPTRLYSHLIGGHIYLIASLAYLPILGWMVVKDRGLLPREVWSLMFMGLGSASLAVEPGLRLTGATLGLGVILASTSLAVRVWGRVKRRRVWRRLAMISALILLAASAAWAWLVSRGIPPSYLHAGFIPLEREVGGLIPAGSTVICPPMASSFLLSLGLRTPWDLYLEHLPEWASERAREAAMIYLAESEGEALKLMGRFGAEWLLVDLDVTLPGSLGPLLRAVGRGESPEEFFRGVEVRESRPKVGRDPVTGGPLWLGTFEEAVVGYEHAPTEAGRQLLLARLLWNEGAVRLRSAPALDPPRRLSLVWRDPSGRAFLYRVVEVEP